MRKESANAFGYDYLWKYIMHYNTHYECLIMRYT